MSHAGHSAAWDHPVSVSNTANTLTHPTGVGRLQPWLRRRGSTPRWVAFGECGLQHVPPLPDRRRRPLRAFSVQSGGDGRGARCRLSAFPGRPGFERTLGAIARVINIVCAWYLDTRTGSIPANHTYLALKLRCDGCSLNYILRSHRAPGARRARVRRDRDADAPLTYGVRRTR